MAEEPHDRCVSDTVPPEVKAAPPLRSAAALHRPPPWPHAPLHKLATSGTYFVTVGTYLKEHHFRGSERLAVLHRGLLTVARDFAWHLEAWAVFSNHYHFVAHSPAAEDNAESLRQMLGRLHERTAKTIYALKTDRLHVYDEYDSAPDW